MAGHTLMPLPPSTRAQRHTCSWQEATTHTQNISRHSCFTVCPLAFRSVLSSWGSVPLMAAGGNGELKWEPPYSHQTFCWLNTDRFGFHESAEGSTDFYYRHDLFFLPICSEGWLLCHSAAEPFTISAVNALFRKTIGFLCQLSILCLFVCVKLPLAEIGSTVCL